MIAQAYERERLAAKVAVWRTLYELGQAREALRTMGEVLEEPPPKSREAFADAIYALHNLTGQGQERSGPDGGARAVATALSLLPGGCEDPPQGAATGKRSVSRAAAYGGQPVLASYRESGQHPSNFETEEQR